MTGIRGTARLRQRAGPGSATRHDLQTAADLFGVAPTELETQTLTEAIAGRQEAEAARHAHGRLVASAIDLFRRRLMPWVSSQPTRYALTVDDGLLLLSASNLQTWRLEHVTRDRRRRVVADGLSLEHDQGVAEDYARQLWAGALVDQQAPCGGNRRRWGCARYVGGAW